MSRPQLPLVSFFRKAFACCALLTGAAAANAVPVTYTLTALNMTSGAGVEIGLGSHVFMNTYTSMTLTFTGDTRDVFAYSQGNTHGYMINQGVATVFLRDVYQNFDLTATFDPGQIYVGTDAGRGVGFGSIIYPIYPFALMETTNVDTASMDLQHDFQMSSLGWGLSCINFVTQSCEPTRTAADAMTHPLHTSLGDLWITTQGITPAIFSISTSPDNSAPTPGTLALVIACCGPAWLSRRKWAKTGKPSRAAA